MTITQCWPLQQAVYARLVAALAGRGIDGVDVPVFDHVPSQPPRLHVRIDGFGVIPGTTSNGRRARHDFSVHVFDDNTGVETGAGRAEVARLQPLIVETLEDWPPLTGATGISHISSTSAADDDALTPHVVSRFSTQIGV